jgi:2-polyprenyl-6-methoxyphenol hydroxylase-like FAD-dependent oxidoreductase
MSDGSNRPPLVIVGAGPAGAALALLLASRDIATTLIERQADFAREFRGELIMPSGLGVLDALGVDVEKDGIPHNRPKEIEIFVERKRVIHVDVDAAFFGDRPPLFVSQPALLEHLVALASRHACFRFIRGSAVRDLVHENGRVAGVRVDGAAGADLLRASLVVGADGRASVVRRRGGFTARERGAPMDVVWTKFPLAGWGDRMRVYAEGGHLLIAYPAPDGLLQVAWVILKGTFSEVKSRGVEDWVREMADHAFADLGAHLRANADRATRPFLLKVVTDRVAGWARPGALLIGDAAHTMSPVGGQGINVALRDAVIAANHLVPVLRTGGGDDTIDAAARRIESERGPEIDRIQELAARPPRVVLPRGPIPRLLRAALPLLVRLPFVRAEMARTNHLFLYGVTGVMLRV